MILIKKKRKRLKSPKKTRSVVSGFIKINEKLKSIFRFNFNLDQSLQKFFQGISNKILEIRTIVQKEREKQKRLRIQAIEKERKAIQNKFKIEQEKELKAKQLELQEEINNPLHKIREVGL